MFKQQPSFEKQEKTYREIESDLPTFDGKKREIKITLEPDGYPKALAFVDIDGTLGHFHNIQWEAIQKLYSQYDPEDVAREFYKGISFGTTYRVHDRMIKIYEDGKEEYRNPEVYWQWFLNHRAEVDESGPIHDKAAEFSLKHSLIASRLAEELYKKDPQSFEKNKIPPVFHLLDLYKRLGIPLAIMTANDAPFAQSICKCLNLADSFILMANQKDFEGRGKEGAIEFLIERARAKGVPIPKKLIVVGDSLKGDIVSGAVFKKEHQEFDVAGVFVTEGNIEEIKEKLIVDPQFQDISVEVLDPSKITENSAGQTQLARFRKEFDTKSKIKN